MIMLKTTIMGTKMVWVKKSYIDYIYHGTIKSDGPQ